MAQRQQSREQAGACASSCMDPHAHLNLKPLRRDVEGVLTRADESGVRIVGNVFLTPAQYYRDVHLLQAMSQVFFLVGIHPHEAANVDDSALDDLEKALRDPRVKAAGEMGLDFYKERSPRREQEKRFRQQLEVALKADAPVVVHSRAAEEQTFGILREMGFVDRPLMWHCFGQDINFAKRLLQCGWTISIPGTVTFKKADALREAARLIPLDSMVLETDCPFLTPDPYRGKTNEPGLLPLIADRVASLRGMDREEVCRATTETGMRFFSLESEAKAAEI